MSFNLISLVFSIHGRPQASIAAIFRKSAGYILVSGSENLFSSHVFCSPFLHRAWIVLLAFPFSPCAAFI